jgi:hypothetical protein
MGSATIPSNLTARIFARPFASKRLESLEKRGVFVKT